MKIRPIYDRILVKRKPEETHSKGGILLPEGAREKPLEGLVVAVGAGKVGDLGERIPLEVKAGDIVAYGKYSGTEVTVEGEPHLILREDEIFGVVEKE